MESAYWEVTFINWFGERQWATAKTPLGWDSYDVRERIQTSDSDYDVSSIIDIVEMSEDFDDNCSWDFCE